MMRAIGGNRANIRSVYLLLSLAIGLAHKPNTFEIETQANVPAPKRHRRQQRDEKHGWRVIEATDRPAHPKTQEEDTVTTKRWVRINNRARREGGKTSKHDKLTSAVVVATAGMILPAMNLVWWRLA